MAASIISSFSRAGLNLVDRYQLSFIKSCPIKTSYFNNLSPLFLAAPCIFIAYPPSDIFYYILSVHVLILASLLQVVSYGFSVAFKRFTLLEIALLTKIPDFLAPLLLYFFGLASSPLYFFYCTCLSLILFYISAKKNLALSFVPSIIFLSISLLVQIIFSFLVFKDIFIDVNFKKLLLISFALLVWRFIFSLVIFLIHQCLYSNGYDKKIPYSRLTFIRCILNLSTQFSFIYVMSSKSYIFVLPILNSTGLIGAFLGHYLIGERISTRDYLSLLSIFLLTNISIFYFIDAY